MSSLFDYDDSQQVAFQAKTAGKSLIAAKYDVIKATGDFLFNAHTDGEFAQRCEMIDDNLNKIAYNKLASLSDSKMKLVKALHTEWSLRHAKCGMCRVASDDVKEASRKVAVSDAEADAWENHPADCDCKLCTNKNDTWGKDIEPSRNKGYNKGDDSAKDRQASRKEAIFDPSWLHQVGHDAAQLAHGLIAPWTHKPSMGPGGIPEANIKDTLIAGGELAAGAAGAAALYNKKKKSKYNNDEEDRPFDWERDASRTASDGWDTDGNGNSTYSEPGQDSWSSIPHTECRDCGAKYEYKGAHPNNGCVGSSSRHEGSYKTSWGIPDQCDGCDQETLNPAQDGWHSEDGLYCPDCADRGYCGCDDCQSGPINPSPHEEMGPHQHGDCPYCSGSECPTCQAMDSGDGEPEQETQLHDELHEKWHRDNGDSPCTSAEDCDRKSRNYKES